MNDQILTSNCARWLIYLCIGLIACERPNERGVAGEVAGEKIYLDEVDGLITNSLYEYLFAIFDARSIATNELINNRLLEIEARARRMTIDSLLLVETKRIGNLETKSKYIRDNALQGGVVEEKNPFRRYQLDSELGREILDRSYRKFLTIRFVEELRAKYGFRILLDRPQPPKIVLEGVLVHAKENINSKNSMTIVSDFDCPVSRRIFPEFGKIFSKYKDRIRFEAINLSPGVTPLILFSECAAKQDKFWEACEVLYSDDGYRTNIDMLIKKIGLNREECLACLESKSQNSRVVKSMAQLHLLGIEVTPTVLINRRVYYGPLESSAIGRFLDEALAATPHETNRQSH